MTCPDTILLNGGPIAASAFLFSLPPPVATQPYCSFSAASKASLQPSGRGFKSLHRLKVNQVVCENEKTASGVVFLVVGANLGPAAIVTTGPSGKPVPDGRRRFSDAVQDLIRLLSGQAQQFLLASSDSWKP